jgi:dUTP pyrophosphatase
MNSIPKHGPAMTVAAPALRHRMPLKIMKTTSLAKTPTYGTDGAACFDLYSTAGGVVEPGQNAVFETGLTFEIPEGWVMLVYSRSGHGFKNSVRLSNCVGVIDSDYRGLLRVKLANDGLDPFFVNIGDRIAQGMLAPVYAVEFHVVDALGETTRGEDGCGSTGA